MALHVECSIYYFHVVIRNNISFDVLGLPQYFRILECDVMQERSSFPGNCKKKTIIPIGDFCEGSFLTFFSFLHEIARQDAKFTASEL